MLRLLPLPLILSALPLLAQAGTPTAAIQTASAKEPKNPSPNQAMEALPAYGWTISAGVMWRQIGEASFDNGFNARESQVPRLDLPSGGQSSGGGYSNGYVRPDAAGGSQTWNWGYTSASQVSGNTLTFQGFNSEVRQSVTSERLGGGWSDDLDGVGVQLEAQSPVLFTWRSLNLSAALGYSFVQDDAGQSGTVFRAERNSFVNQYGVTDVYDITAIAPLPQAPYSGTFNGPGPVISTTPLSSTRSGGGGQGESHQDVFLSEVSSDLDIRLHTISLGPKVSMYMKHVRILAGLGLALNVADWDADYEERFTWRRDGGSRRTLRQWQDSSSGTEVVPGFYLEASVEVPIARRWSVFLTGRYDWAGSVEGTVGPSSFDVDLSGWTAVAGFAFRL